MGDLGVFMRSVFSEEMDVIWNKYDKVIFRFGSIEFLEADEEYLQKMLKLNFKELLQHVKARACIFGKTRPQVRYSVLKLRRLIALWSEKNVLCGDFKITYRDSDIYRQFPLFDRQNFEVMPSVYSIRKMKAKIIDKFIEENNRMFVEHSKKDELKPIKNLKDLRQFFYYELGFDNKLSTELTNIYKEYSAKNEVRDFSDSLELN